MHVILETFRSADGLSVAVETNPTALLSSIISSYCVKTGIKYSSQFVIYDERGRPLPLYSTIATLRIENGQKLFIGKEDSSFSVVKQWPIIVAFATLLIGLIGILTMSLVYGLKGGEFFDDYGVVMDAGSSKTNTIVYKWRSSKHRGTGCVTQEDNCFAKGGIAKMNPMELDPVIECAKNVTSVIGTEYRAKTPLFFAATAGMRLLNLTNSSKAQEILEQLKLHLPETHLNTKAVEIISGRDEGIYGWTTINFLLNTLDLPQESDPWEPTTFGALDMGGASMQISYALPISSAANVSQDVTNFQLYGQTYSVFSQSNLCFGRDEAQKRYHALLLLEKTDNRAVVEDPCAPEGYSRKRSASDIFESICARLPNVSNLENITYTYVGTSNAKICREKVLKLLDNELCKKLGFKGCFKLLSDLPEKQKYKAFATFFFTTKFLNVTNKNLSNYEDSVYNFCMKNWTEIQKIANNPYGLQYCFNGQYIYTVLIKGFRFNSSTWQNLEFINEISHTEVGWTLGYMIKATNLIPEKKTPRLISTVALAISLAIFIIVILATAIFLLLTCKKGGPNK